MKNKAQAISGEIALPNSPLDRAHFIRDKVSKVAGIKGEAGKQAAIDEILCLLTIVPAAEAACHMAYAYAEHGEMFLLSSKWKEFALRYMAEAEGWRDLRRRDRA